MGTSLDSGVCGSNLCPRRWHPPPSHTLGPAAVAGYASTSQMPQSANAPDAFASERLGYYPSKPCAARFQAVRTLALRRNPKGCPVRAGFPAVAPFWAECQFTRTELDKGWAVTKRRFAQNGAIDKKPKKEPSPARRPLAFHADSDPSRYLTSPALGLFRGSPRKGSACQMPAHEGGVVPMNWSGP